MLNFAVLRYLRVKGTNRDELRLHMAAKIYGSNSKAFISYRKGPYLVSLPQMGTFSEDLETLMTYV